MGYLFVALTVLLTVYGQLVLKWQVSAAGQFPADLRDQAFFVGHLLLNPWVLSGLAAAFLASSSWILCLTKLQLSQAYPFTAVSYVLVLISSATLFGEPMSAGKVVGTLLVVSGILVVAVSTGRA